MDQGTASNVYNCHCIVSLKKSIWTEWRIKLMFIKIHLLLKMTIEFVSCFVFFYTHNKCDSFIVSIKGYLKFMPPGAFTFSQEAIAVCHVPFHAILLQLLSQFCPKLHCSGCHVQLRNLWWFVVSRKFSMSNQLKWEKKGSIETPKSLFKQLTQ